MVKEWFFNIILVLSCTFFVNAQEVEDEFFKDQGLSFKAQTLVLLPYDDGTNGDVYDTDYELEDNTFVFGLNAELNYYFNQNLGVGIGFGYEKINQPNFFYYPVYFNLIGVLNDNKDALYAKANFGTHLGDLDKSGFVFRGGLGYGLKVFKTILSNFEFTYSYQNIYKTFTNSERPENYYNIESIGITIGIEFN
tara:strand:+ start:81 stop:662 length:582 start_codon:yes stop_codon:yes gene_type:complete